MPGLIRGIARTAVIAGTATAVSNRVSRRQAGRWAEQDQQAAYGYGKHAADEPPPAEAEPEAGGLSMDDKLAQLKQLGELKSQGVLTEEEFQQQKSRILNG
jgi:Short C-terminal domain